MSGKKTFLLILWLALAVLPGAARAQDTLTLGDGVIAKSFPIVAAYAEPGAPSIGIENSRMTLIGDATDKKIGVSYRGSLTSDRELTGEEKAWLYLYATCDDEAPSRSNGVNVGKVNLGPLTAGRRLSSLIVATETTSLVPLDEVKCGKISVVCPNCTPVRPPEYLTKTVPVPDRTDLPQIDIGRMSVVLLGESTSNTFSLSYRGTLTPKSEMEGKEKIVVYLYRDECDGKNATQTDALNVGSAAVGVVPTGRARSTMITTVDAKAAVPVSEIKCGRVAVECATCRTEAPEDQVYVPLLLAENKDLTNLKTQDILLGMYGQSSAKTFDISYRGTLAPGAAMTGKEKLVLYLYDKACDDKDPARSAILSVGSVNIGGVPVGVERAALVSTVEVTAIVPLSAIKCGKLAIVCRECAPAGQPPGKDYMITTLKLSDRDDKDLRMSNVSISLVGDPNSSSFGVSFRGTAVPRLKLLGGETLVARLYMQCDDNEPQTTNGTNVGTIELHAMTAGNQRADVLVTTQGSAFVPLKDIQCVKIGLKY